MLVFKIKIRDKVHHMNEKLVPIEKPGERIGEESCEPSTEHKENHNEKSVNKFDEKFGKKPKNKNTKCSILMKKMKALRKT